MSTSPSSAARLLTNEPSESADTRSILRVENLSAGYGGREVARLPYLELAAGSTLLLLGPSGSGKTTLLLAIAGLAEIFSGSARIDGKSLNELPAGERDQFRGHHLGFVFQDIHLVHGLSVIDNLLLAPFALGLPQDRRRASELLDAMGLRDSAQQPAHTLSRGQAQRVAIARAMLLRPRLILADEPTASLDDSNCENVASLLERAVAETGAALLIATHDQRLRRHFSAELQIEKPP